MYLTLTKEVKFHCPAGFDENIFACTCRMIQEKVNNARQAGVTDIKTVNTVKKDNFMCVFNFPEDVYDSAWAQATGGEDPVYTIDTGKSRGTTFKIDTGGYVFSCLFDSGAEISCMNMDTIAALGLTSQITPSSVSVNTANGDHMGVADNVRVHFKIGKKCSFTHSFVVCKRLSHPFIIGEDFMRKHYMSLQWVPENKHALGFQGETIAVASQAMLDEPLRLRNAIQIPPRSTVMAPGYCNQMFNGKATVVPCTELKQRFPNLYMEPMQMNNSENKSYDTIPYMLINLGDVDTIYIGRDTLIAYIKGEDASCEYLEVNEIIEDVRGINWQPPHTRKMVTSDLVYSPAQTRGAEGSKHLRRHKKKV